MRRRSTRTAPTSSRCATCPATTRSPRCSRSALDLDVRLTRAGETVAQRPRTGSRSTTSRSSGSLYERIVERLVKPDTERQAPGPLARLPPVVPGPADRRPQGRALHARADRRHRPQAPQPGRSRLARARRPLPRAADRARDRRGGQGRLRRPADARGARGVRDLGGVRGHPRGAQRRGLARRLGAAEHRRSAACRAPAGLGHEPAQQAPRDARVPARPPRGPRARDRARRAEHRATRRRPGIACSATPSARSCARRPTRSPSSPTSRPRCAGSCSGTGRATSACGACCACPGPLPRLLGDQDGLFALGLQPVPRLDEPRRRLGAGAAG